MLKRSLRRFVAYIAYHASVVRSGHLAEVVILTYHRVLPDIDERRAYIQPGMYVTVSSFERHIQALKKNFTIIRFDDLLSMKETGVFDKAKRYCIITFDDGWGDNYRYAYPVLKRNNVPASIFLPTDFIGTKRRFWTEELVEVLFRTKKGELSQKALLSSADSLFNDPQVFVDYLHKGLAQQGEALEAIIDCLKCVDAETRSSFLSEITHDVVFDDTFGDFMTWNMAREMSGAGISFGSHGCTHSILTDCNLTAVQKELLASKDKILMEGVRFDPVFCFPNGDYDSHIIELALASGYRACVTTKRGRNACENICLGELKRVAIHEDIASDKYLFQFHLDGILDRG